MWDHPNIRSIAGLHNLAGFDLLRITDVGCGAPSWPALPCIDQPDPSRGHRTSANLLHAIYNLALSHKPSSESRRSVCGAQTWADPGLSLPNEHYEAHNDNNKPSHHQTAERVSERGKGPSWHHYHIQGTGAKTQTKRRTHPLILCQF